MDMTMFRRRGLLLSTPHIVNESGSIVTFDSAYNKIPIKSLICSIEPVQDLHGYDHPWPAGGGKNLCMHYIDRQSNNGITYTPSLEGIEIKGTATGPSYSWDNTHAGFENSLIKLSAGTYTFSSNASPGNSQTQGYIVFMGQTESGTDINNFVLTATSLTRTVTFSENVGIYYGIFVANGITANLTAKLQIESGSTATSWSPYSNICPISGRTGLTVSHSEADTSDPATISVNWETEAGTVYGGTLDVVSGKLTVGWTSDDMGQYDWGGNNGMFNFFNLHNISPSWTRNSIDWMRCSAYKPESWNSIDNGTYSDYSIHGLAYNGFTVLRIYDSRYQTVTDFKTGVSGTQFAYELATPTEIQLTPQEVRTLLGTNNIWCDSGNVSVNYWKWGK